MTLRESGVLLWRAFEGLEARKGVEISGYIAFTVMLALFPFMIFLVSVAGFLGQTSTAANFLDAMSLFSPPEVVATLRPAVLEVIANRSGGLLTIGLLIALYSAASGVSALRMVLNSAYGVAERRHYLVLKLEDALIVIVGSVIAILASAITIFEPFLLNILLLFTHIDRVNLGILHLARYAVALLIIALSVIALHRVLPAEKLKFRQILPGALMTTVLWVIAAGALNIYFGSLANYTTTYGSLGGVMVTLMFFYVTGIIFIFGGELNAVLLTRAADGRTLKPE